MKIRALFFWTATTAWRGLTLAEDSLPGCRSFDLSFDNTPGVRWPETRGLLVEQDFYRPVGIASLVCIRKDESPDSSTCRLFDTARPVGLWDRGLCNCEPNRCASRNQCGDPDLASDTLGNVLIVEERERAEASDFPPDDNAFGGTILMEFIEPVTVVSMSFLDIESSRPVVMEFTHADGLMQIIGPVTGDNGQATAGIYLDDVTAITITLFGSGAVTSIRYTRNCFSNNGGDPHFTRWNQVQRDSFQGECDLVLVQTPLFQVHVRTTITFYYSYIAAAAVQVGNHIVQVNAEQPDHVVLDGVQHVLDASPQDDSFQASRVHLSTPATLVFGDGNSTYHYAFEEAHSSTKKRVYRLDLTDWSYVRFKMYGKFMTVSIHAGDEQDFQGGTGLLGRYPDGEMVRRGETEPSVPHSFAEFALEWQVNPTMGDPILFDTARPPQMPYEICRLPTLAQPARRHLLRGRVSMNQALDACRSHGVPTENLNLCVDDILSADDLGLATIW